MRMLCWAAACLFPFPRVFGGAFPPVMGVAVLEDDCVLVGRDYILWNGHPGSLSAGETGCERFFGPASSPDGKAVAVWAGSDHISRILKVTREGFAMFGPYERAGLPCWDHDGNLWYTADGSLMVNGEESGLSLSAHHVSVSPRARRLVHTDRQDRLLVMCMVTSDTDTLSTEHRYFGPFFVTEQVIVSPSLDGGIWWFEGCEPVFVDFGEHPVWWPERNALVFVKTTDDGISITSSDIWLWTREGGSERLTLTPGVFEMNPAPSSRGIHYVDVRSGRTGFLEVLP